MQGPQIKCENIIFFESCHILLVLHPLNILHRVIYIQMGIIDRRPPLSKISHYTTPSAHTPKCYALVSILTEPHSILYSAAPKSVARSQTTELMTNMQALDTIASKHKR